MIEKPSDIRKLRQKHSLTQSQLANIANVSQSFITKIEKGLIEPTYSKMHQILDALKHLDNKNQKTAKDIMQKKIISIKPETILHSASLLMKKHNISQLPVLENKFPVGILSESSIIRKLSETNDFANISKIHVRDAMDECPPTISLNTNFNIINNMLSHFSTLFVLEKGKFIGIITKSDVINNLL